MVFTPFGIVTFVKFQHLSNAPSAIAVMPSGISKLLSDLFFGKHIIYVFSLLYKMPFSEQYALLPSATLIFVKPIQV